MKGLYDRVLYSTSSRCLTEYGRPTCLRLQPSNAVFTSGCKGFWRSSKKNAKSLVPQIKRQEDVAPHLVESSQLGRVYLWRGDHIGQEREDGLKADS